MALKPAPVVDFSAVWLTCVSLGHKRPGVIWVRTVRGAARIDRRARPPVFNTSRANAGFRMTASWLLTRNQKINVPGYVNHCDDELAFLSFSPLLLYEKDPELRKVYAESLGA